MNVILDGGYFVGNGGKGIGVFTRGTNNLRVTNSSFNNWGTGISRMTNVANQYTQVEKVNMSQCVQNIWASVLPSKADIQFNDLSAVSHNVWLSGISGQHKWNIRHNNALRSGTTPPSNMPSISYVNRNIFFNNVLSASINYNESNFTSPSTNIYITGGQKNVVGNNILAAPSSTKQNLEISTSPFSSIYCNDMGGADKAMVVMNNCTPSVIDINDFSGATGDFNLVYGSSTNTFAQTGKQFLTGNIFDESTDETPVAKNFEPIDYYATQSQYQVGKYYYAPGIGNPENIQGETPFHYPFFESSSNQWFKKNNSGTDHYNCVNELTEQELLEKAAQTNIDLLNARIDTVYGEEVVFDTKLKLYRHLEELQELTTLTGDFEIWHDDSLSGTDFAKFIEFENMYREAVTFNVTDTADIERLHYEVDSLANLIDTLSEEMDSIVWWVTDTSTNSLVIDTTQITDIVTNRAFLDQKLDTLNILIMDRQAVLDTMLDDMLSINNSIGTPATTSGENLKTVNGYLLERYDSEFEGFDETDSTALAEIANQCVGEGGEAVYIARALLAEYSLDYVEYEDECIEPRSSPGNSRQGSLTSTLKIMPNPADDAMNVILPTGHKISSLTLLDAYGRVIQVFGIKRDQALLKLNTSGLSTGIYFLVPFKGEDGPVKFAVQH